MDRQVKAVADGLLEIVSDESLHSIFNNTNFGACSPREIVADTLLKLAGGYSTGYTALTCCRELGLIGKKTQKLTKAGEKYLYFSCKSAFSDASLVMGLVEAIKQSIIARGNIRIDKVFRDSEVIVAPLLDALASLPPKYRNATQE